MTKRLVKWSITLGGSALAIAALRRANRLPEHAPRTPDAMPHTSDTQLAAGIRKQTRDHPDQSGVHLLSDGIDAFAARALLIHAAQARLDVQYYIWHGERTGTLLLEALHRAAERGVRVRLLLDDNGISGLDQPLAALDLHPNIEVRLFNPFPIRFPKALGFLLDFPRLNRRMHNKSLTADSAVTIVGGRNVGDEYFAAGDASLFADLDVMAVGPIVADVESDFERYWNSQSVYPASAILPRVGASKLRRLSGRATIVERDASARHYVRRVRDLPLVEKLADGTLDFEWASVRMVSDDPAKGLGKAAEQDLLLPKLERTIGPVRREIGLISGYFVPGDKGAQRFADLARWGVAVRVLTNGYAASDVALVHAGYAPYRRQLLAAGVRLFEMQPTDSAHESDGKGTHIGIARRLQGSGTGSTAALRSGATTLHAKTFTIDRERLFVGSFNLDPRSFRLNTEVGFVIESPTLAARIADVMADRVPEQACEVMLDDDGELFWRSRENGSPTARRREPGMTLADHLLIGVASHLPIAPLL